MFACTLLLLLFLPAVFLPLVLESYLPSNELTEMGIQLDLAEQPAA